MPLTCDCDYDGDFAWYYGNGNFGTLTTKRSRKCRSCSKRISVGEPVMEFDRWRQPENDIEERIYGDDGEMPLASYYLCEPCSDLYSSLEELGYCVSPDEDQRALVKEYAELHRQAKPPVLQSAQSQQTGEK